MELFERLWEEMQEAFRRRNLFAAIKVLRFSTPITMGLKETKNYVERYWNMDGGLEAMKADLMIQLGIESPATEEKKSVEEIAAILQGIKVVQDENFALTVKKEVSWDQMNEFFAKAARELGF
ncbi:MAG: hypothetical protein G01um10143_464 [Parcubacteria group bacterium Gr01-1014_3]|nr:MAG: hypothetical protein G01um10143_464 [Parcubacteria group bacterium Gr01-1014_3]